MSGQPWALAAAATLLLGASAYLAAVETVVTRLSTVRALRMAEEEHRGARRLLWLVERRASALDALLTATVLVRVLLAVTAMVLGAAVVDGMVGPAVAVGSVVVLSLVLGEVAPRTLTLRHLEAAGRTLAPSAGLLVRGLGPVARLLVVAGRALVPRRQAVSGPHASDDELRELEADEDSPELEPEERAMIRSIFELAETRVREIMVPRPDMVTLAADAPLAELVELIVDRGYSRVPVHTADDPDVVVGVIHAKDLLRRLAAAQERTDWRDLLRPPTFVPETKRSDELLRELQAQANHLALVVDEYGELVGLVTIEDILEEIVGEIVDEHDHEEPLVEPLADGRLRVDARFGVDDLNELLGTALPEEGWDTVGGLVVATLGRIPDVDERVELEGATLTVEQVQGRRVAKVLVEPRGPDAGDPAATGESAEQAGQASAGPGGEPTGAVRGGVEPRSRG